MVAARTTQLRRRVGCVGALAFAMLSSGCEFDKTILSKPEDRVVVHAVLDPGQGQQLIFLERTLTGRIAISDSGHYDSLDPITTGGGDPISGARVVIYREGADSVVALEVSTARPDKKGAGVYIFRTLPPDGASGPANRAAPVWPLVPGAHYRLRVTTADGRIVTGTTTIPDRSLSQGIVVSTLAIDRDSLKLQWNSVPAARVYALRIDSPFGAFFLFTDSTHFTLTGSLRNFFAEALPLAFLPGFDQAVIVSAVDTNFFDYYRSQNDPFSGKGLINHLNGGIGMFASSVSFVRRRITVTKALQLDSIDGHYAARPQDDFSIDLFAIQKTGPLTAISGRASGTLVFAPSRGVVGSVRDGSVSFSVIGSLVNDTVDVFSGKFLGDSIVGTFKSFGPLPVTFRRLGRARP